MHGYVKALGMGLGWGLGLGLHHGWAWAGLRLGLSNACCQLMVLGTGKSTEKKVMKKTGIPCAEPFWHVKPGHFVFPMSACIT